MNHPAPQPLRIPTASTSSASDPQAYQAQRIAHLEAHILELRQGLSVVRQDQINMLRAQADCDRRLKAVEALPRHATLSADPNGGIHYEGDPSQIPDFFQSHLDAQTVRTKLLQKQTGGGDLENFLGMAVGGLGVFLIVFLMVVGGGKLLGVGNSSGYQSASYGEVR